MVSTELNEGWSTLGVPSVITKALVEQNFYSPTTIQALALPPAILGRRDILGAAETGSGKTLAFGIPVLNGILELQKKQSKMVPSTSGKFTEINKDEQVASDCSEDEGDENDEPMPEEQSIDKNGIGLVKVVDNVKFDEFDNTKPTKPLYALILTPTRELAIQIKDHLTKAAKYTDIKVLD